jgi:hypothetical protein
VTAARSSPTVRPPRSREQVGGYTLVECADLDEALTWAAMIPAAQTGWVEIRPVVATRVPS